MVAFAFLGLLSMVGFIVFLIIGVVAHFKKNGKAKRNLIYSGSLFVLFIVALAITPPVEPTTNPAVVEEKKSNPVEVTLTNEEKEKIAEEAKKKAEEEARAKVAAEEKRKAEEEAKAKAEAEAAKPDLELLESKESKDAYTRYVVGSVKNNTDREYSYVQVEINLYDKDGAQIGSTLANANNLEAGGVWKFKAIILEDNAKSFKVKDITGF